MLFLLINVPAFSEGHQPQDRSHKIHHYAYFARDRELINHPQFISNPAFEGAQIMYVWKQLEPQEGVYDFSEIEHDLNHLKSHHKKIFIQLQDVTFSAHRKPTPIYLESNLKYGGGAVPQYNEAGEIQGWVTRRWDPNVQEKFKQLLCALSQEFDGKIAGINLQETAIEVTHREKEPPAGFSPAVYRDAILLNMAALKSCFKQSLVMQYANFMPGEWLPWDDFGYLASVYAYAQKNQIAIGTPDLMPRNKGQQNHAYQFMHAGQNTFGVAVQDGNYFDATGNPEVPDQYENMIPELYAYAQDVLHVKYMFWVIQEPFFSRDLVPFLNRKP